MTFAERISYLGLALHREPTQVVQLNLGALCNQACMHCHVEAGPHRTEVMPRNVAERCLEFLSQAPGAALDLTGGAPELNPDFRFLVEGARRMGRQVMVRTNLTVLLEEGCQDLPAFCREQQVALVASLPCYTRENVDAQRQPGTFDKSIQALEVLNRLGYGLAGGHLPLMVVYNPGDAFLPGGQAELEDAYRRELRHGYGVEFTGLFTMTNMPLGRFGRTLVERDELGDYQRLLEENFSAATASEVMCLGTVNIGWDGVLYDCDFNNAARLPLGGAARPLRVGEIGPAELVGLRVEVGEHCYGCTAGAGSSCQGALVTGAAE